MGCTKPLAKALLTEFGGIAGLLTADAEALARVPGMGETSARNLFEAINARRTISLERLIFSLGVRHVGEQTGRTLAKGYGTTTGAQARALRMLTALRETKVDDIFDEGLHDFLSRVIREVALLGSVVHETYLSGDLR